MYKSSYETHHQIDMNMPFIYHSKSTLVKKHNMPNWHENFELFLCTDGSGQVHLDGDAVEFEAGDIVIVNTNVIHALATDSSLTSYCLIVSNEFCVQNGVRVNELSFDRRIRSPKLYQLCIEAFEKIEEYKKTQKYYTLTAVRGKLCAIMSELCENHVITDEGNKRISSVLAERMKKLIIYINDNLSTDLTLDRLSSYVGISKYHLARDFKKITSQTIFEFINNMRCKNAKQMLADGSSVSEAAYSCGFNNLSYFTRKFTEVIGEAPSTYIKFSVSKKLH